MNTIDCINTKRSVRKYTNQPIPQETIQRLLKLGTMASTGSNHQPWGFVVISDAAEIEALSEEIKAYLRANLAQYPYLAQYEDWLKSDSYSVFNHAPVLIIVYGDTASHWYVYDGSLAAGNIMLAAHDMNIGTCWIGFAEYWMNTPAFKKKYNVPDNYALVAPLGCGWRNGEMTPPKRKEPVVFYG